MDRHTDKGLNEQSGPARAGLATPFRRRAARMPTKMLPAAIRPTQTAPTIGAVDDLDAGIETR